MVDETLDPPPATPPTAAASTPLLRPRRVAFEYGLLPIPKLIFPEGMLAQTLSQLKEKLAPAAASSGDGRVGAVALAEATPDPGRPGGARARRARGGPPHGGPRARRRRKRRRGPPRRAALPLHPVVQAPRAAPAQGLPCRRRRLALHLRVRRLPFRPLADPDAKSPSPRSVLVRSNSRRFIPSQADEEIHQLSYLQKHMANILTLLADSVEGEGDDSLVLTMETFEHLGFLVHFSEGTSLSQAATFFANSDPDMPAAPVSAAQVHDWILQNIASSLEFYTEKSIAKEGSQQIASDLDVTMADANTSHPRNNTPTVVNPAFHRNSTFVEGFSKTSVVKHASDVKGHSVKVLNCHDSVIYILAPVKYATVYGCSDTTVVLGAVGKVVKVEHCERVHIIAAAKRICIANCRECIFYLGVNHQPLIVGDNHKLHIAPFNTYYPRLGEHMTQVGVDPSTNKWDQPFVLGAVDPHDSLSHPAGVSDVQAEPATCVDPDLFTNFLIPNLFEDALQNPTKCNPFPLPEIYQASQSKKQAVLEDTQKTIRELQLDENRKKELASALHAQFKDWLYVTVGALSPAVSVV
ncbi:hypothetical protein ACQ4PT_049930 [Festuca glaucescens]